jgi:hypothetical protein
VVELFRGLVKGEVRNTKPDCIRTLNSSLHRTHNTPPTHPKQTAKHVPR